MAAKTGILLPSMYENLSDEVSQLVTMFISQSKIVNKVLSGDHTFRSTYTLKSHQIPGLSIFFVLC